jgi:predicted nucleic acid-binding protein
VILADTSIWIDYFRSGMPELRNLLSVDEVAMHPFVIAELALGSLHDRARTLYYLDLLPPARITHLSEVRRMIEAHSLYSKGIGLTDAHLIASCLLTPGTQLWTRDVAMMKVAAGFGILVNPTIAGKQIPQTARI